MVRGYLVALLSVVAGGCRTAAPDYPNADDIPWQQPQPPGPEQALQLADGAVVHYRVGSDAGDMAGGTLRCIDRDGSVRWSLSEPPPDRRPNPLAGMFYEPAEPREPARLNWREAVLAADDNHLYAAQPPHYASGPSVVAIALRTGETRWSAWLQTDVQLDRYEASVSARTVSSALVTFCDHPLHQRTDVFSPSGARLSSRITAKSWSDPGTWVTVVSGHMGDTRA
jgi:hypothetical protein